MVDAEAARRLFGAVLIRGIRDALSDTPRASVHEGTRLLEKDAATNWIVRNTKDFREVCDMAGFDPDFVRDAFMSGKITKHSFVRRPTYSADKLDLKKAQERGKVKQERVGL